LNKTFQHDDQKNEKLENISANEALFYSVGFGGSGI